MHFVRIAPAACQCYDIISHRFTATDQDLEKLFTLLCGPAMKPGEPPKVLASELGRSRILPRDVVLGFAKEPLGFCSRTTTNEMPFTANSSASGKPDLTKETSKRARTPVDRTVAFDYEEFKSIAWPKLKERWMTKDSFNKQKAVEDGDSLTEHTIEHLDST
eukprot:s1076_g2.t1